MKKFYRLKAVLGLVLCFTLLATSINPFTVIAEENVSAAEAQNDGYYFEKIDNSAIKATAGKKGALNEKTPEIQFADDDTVRVSIVLEGDSVIDAGFSTEDLAENDKALELIENVKEDQKSMEEKIEEAIGEDLDVQWNLTVAANIISADVAYGNLEEIANVEGVKGVIVETKYLPCSPVESADPEMIIAQNVMTGVANAWKMGYTGAGGRIAIIDTGLDIQHQSFNNDAFLYALAEDAAYAGYENTADYIKKINLLDTKGIDKVLELTNAYAKVYGNLSADDLYISEKIPFGFNYVDKSLYVEHYNDGQGEHGSHVAGIAAANRYLETEDGAFVDALDTVCVAGNAPDAQVLVMKVFGVGGGAYDSDYMAAIEDAILLGCDSVNLSLGSAAPGFTTSTSYQYVMDKLTSSETVVAMSAGNNGAWADNTFTGVLYNNDVNFMTGGQPGSFTNSLTVASVENYGYVTNAFAVDGVNYSFNESTEYGNKAIATLTNGEDEAEFDYIFVDGVGVEEDFAGIDLTGKVVFCSRGTTSFFEKANVIASKGAVAGIIYNNQDGKIGLNLTGYEYTMPCVSITQADAAAIRAISEEAVTEAGLTYYSGKLTVLGHLLPVLDNKDTFTMSDYSSWGVPGNLSLKPEITAPGGMIYSLAGYYYDSQSGMYAGGHDQYELMSGTSMAAPQITGMMAVLKRFVKESWSYSYSRLSNRTIAQSLLMSTATPMVAEGNYVYSVFEQGAGLANLEDALKAASFIIMDENATVSAADGKVKAELGDDPEKTGVYTFGFDITNISKVYHKYQLDDYVFTQVTDGEMLYGDTWGIDADVTFIVDGKNVSDVQEEANPFIATVESYTETVKKAYNNYIVLVEELEHNKALAEETRIAISEAEYEVAVALEAYTRAQEALVIATANRGTSAGEKAYKAAKSDAAYAFSAYSNAQKVLSNAKKTLKNLESTIVAQEKTCASKLATYESYTKKLEKAIQQAEAWQPSVAKNEIRVNKDQTVHVDVEIALTAETKELLDEFYPNGAYVEAYIFLDSEDETSSHSIPVLAYYGNWTDPSMFEKGSYLEYVYAFNGIELTQDEVSSLDFEEWEIDTLTYDLASLLYMYGYLDFADLYMFFVKAGIEIPYLYEYNDLYANAFTITTVDDGGEYYFGDNMFEYDDAYDPERAAMSSISGDFIDSVYFTLIRSAAQRAIIISNAETGEIYSYKTYGSQASAYWSDNQQSWFNTESSLGINWKGTDAEGNALPEGTKVDITLVAVPEYSVDANGNIDFASLGDGAFFSTSLTIDNTAPEIKSIGTGEEYGWTDTEEETDLILITAEDNRNVAAIYLYAEDGEELIETVPCGNKKAAAVFSELEADIYLVQVWDYAGNASTYRVFLKTEPATEVESIELNTEELSLIKNNKGQLIANVQPTNLLDRSVIWVSSDETIATVDENGVVTGVGLGECIIGAFAAADPDFYAMCYVSVIELDYDLNCVVWDENGEVWFSEINTTSIPEYKKLTEVSTDAAINGVAYGPDWETIYASDLDTSSGSSMIYTVDPTTLDVNPVGLSSIAYTDIAEAPHLTGLIGTYFNYVVLIDPETGDYEGAFDYCTNDLVGITYIGSQYHSGYGAYLDMYYLLDSEGNIYFDAFIGFGGSYYYFYGEDDALYGSTGISCDTSYFQSFYFNGDYTFIANFNDAANCVALYAVDTEETGAMYLLGTFGDGVWPVAGLNELYLPDADFAAAKGAAFETAEIKAEVSTEAIEKVEFKALSK